MTQAFTFTEMARAALKAAPTPMSAPELWAYAETKRLTGKLTRRGSVTSSTG